MIALAPILLYAALACATVVPPPGQSPVVAPVAATPLPPRPTTKPAWDLLGICTELNVRGVQTHPSLNPD